MFDNYEDNVGPLNWVVHKPAEFQLDVNTFVLIKNLRNVRFLCFVLIFILLFNVIVVRTPCNAG